MHPKRNDHRLETELIRSPCSNSVRQIVRGNDYCLVRDPGTFLTGLDGKVFHHLAPLAAAQV